MPARSSLGLTFCKPGRAVLHRGRARVSGGRSAVGCNVQAHSIYTTPREGRLKSSRQAQDDREGSI